jgi:outer membrane immunogenic protein
MYRTKLALLAGTSLCMGLGLGFSQAADMPVKALIAKAPIVDPWTGLYVGGNLGYSWGHMDSRTSVAPFTQPDSVPPFFTFTFPGGSSFTSLKPVGLIGGVQAGYNWRVARDWLSGIEADFQWSGEKSSRRGGFSGATTDCTSGDCSFTNTNDITARLTYFGTLRGKTGPQFDGVWVYVTGGVAYGRVSIDGVNTLVLVDNVAAAVVGTYSSAFSYSKTLLGLTAGIGIEGLIGMTGWRWKAEFIHINLGSIGNVVSPPLVTFTPTRFTDDILRIGLNYRLTGGP